MYHLALFKWFKFMWNNIFWSVSVMKLTWLLSTTEQDLFRLMLKVEMWGFLLWERLLTSMPWPDDGGFSVEDRGIRLICSCLKEYKKNNCMNRNHTMALWNDALQKIIYLVFLSCFIAKWLKVFYFFLEKCIKMKWV